MQGIQDVFTKGSRSSARALNCQWFSRRRALAHWHHFGVDQSGLTAHLHTHTRARVACKSDRLISAPCRHDSHQLTCLTFLCYGVLFFGLTASASAQDLDAVTVEAGGLQGLLQAILAFSDTAGPAGVAVFIAVYAVACVLLIPASLLTLGAGALYGPFLGTAVVSAASTLGCSLAFLISRYVARPFAEKRLMANERFVAVDAGISRKGGYIVFLLRLSPLVPFGLMNYMMGITKVELPAYVLASWAGMLPGTFAYVYLGSLGKEAAQGLTPTKLILYAVGAVATILATREISKVASNALSEAVDSHSDDNEPLTRDP